MYNENLGTPISWIVRITRNKSIDKLRSKSFKLRENECDIERFYHLSSEQTYENPESVLTLNNVRHEIKTAINKLTEIQKELLEFAYFRGYSQSELAEHFEMPLGTVKTCIRTAMMKLRNKLKHLIN
ncbi:MAG: sigma-70 family RNA polymerase sigma factor [Ignavibacteria bacterium]|nr:sigma-70 family RNA polymerase sigma factor [Ignavibacteria bacterium]